MIRLVPARSFTTIALLFLCFAHISAQTVFINQSGYKPEGYKYFYTDADAGNFSICRSDNNAVVFEGSLTSKIENDPATGANILRGDFSEFKTEGNYYIKISDALWSDQFNISVEVYEDVLYKSLKSYYYQRCGIELTQEFAEDFRHPLCHASDGTYHSTAGLQGNRNTSGGWHDAGDFGKYIVNSGISVGTILMGYEFFPLLFGMDNLNIPGSGNGLPDILDECRFQIEWMLKMQNDDGGVFFKVTAANFPGYIMPQNDRDTRYIYQISSTATADFTAVMAKSYRIYKNFDSSFADICLAAAEKGAGYLGSNPNIVPAGGFVNPPGTSSGGYGDGNDRDERMWAYAELFLSTGKQEYFGLYTGLLAQLTPFNNEMSWPNVAQMGNLAYLFLTEEDNPTKILLHNALVGYCDNVVNSTATDGFNVAIEPNEYNWGSTSSVLNSAVLLIMGYELTNNEEYLKTALQQFNYSLGTNIHNMSFITGVGNRYPMRIHHRATLADNVFEPVPGLIAGGPNSRLQDNILRANFTAATPPARCYVDHADSYASNEVAINWNAPLVFAAGYFNAKEYTTSIEEEYKKYLPGDFKLEQNYPNPFNGQTKINFYLPGEGDVVFTIYNLLGERVFKDEMGLKPAGENLYSWAAADDYGNGVNSGIYFYELKFNELSLTKKLLYLK